MTPVTLALVLAAAVLHAIWNLWAKQVGPAARSAPLMWLMVCTSALVYAPFALTIAARAHWRPDGAALGFIAGSGVIHVAYFLLLLRGYRLGDLSLVYPVARGSGPLFASFVALALFRERVTAPLLAGVALVAAGVGALAWRPAGRRASAGPAIRHGLAVGGCIALYTLWDGWSVKRAGIPPLVFYWGGEVTRVLLFTPAALAQRREVAALWREQRPRIVGIALASPLSYVLVLTAMRFGAVSRIAPARELSIVVGAWLGGSVLGEGDRRRRLVAALALAGGVVALALS